MAAEALSWTPAGRRNQDRPSDTWRRLADKEKNEFGLRSWIL